MVAGALLTGWWSATLLHPSAPQQAGRINGPRPLGGAVPSIVTQAERLRQHLAQPPQPSRGRNPFVYAPRLPSHRESSYRETPVEAAPPAPVVPLPPPLPIFKLSGIASNVEDGVAVLTAIMNDNGALVFAKPGDKLSHGYSVVTVDEASVTIVDADGVTRTVRLP
jgi:hypothetical protein